MATIKRLHVRGGKTKRVFGGHRQGVVALARSVNRAIARDPKLRAAGIKPLPVRYVLVPVDPSRPDGPLHAATWQARYTDGVARPNRADRRFAESKHQRKLARRATLESVARMAGKAVDA